jgi:glycosyltransferase involved in cell wall biosynthesis
LLIWLLTIGEPWPIDGDNPRLHRTGTMARLYAKGGDRVVWFNNTFDHYRKAYRFTQSTTIELQPNLTLVGLHGRAYSKNASMRRILHHRGVTADFRRIAKTMPTPEVIVASMPPLELSRTAVRYGKRHNVPVIVDIRDLWPDIFLEVFPKNLQWAGRLAIAPFYRMLKESVNKANAISGVTEHAVDWALKNAKKQRGQFDGALPLAYEPEEFSDAALRDAGKFWDDIGIRADSKALTVCFMGSLTRRVEFDTVLAAARMFPPEMERKVRFVLCGAGERAKDIEKCAAESRFMISPGWINAPQIAVLMKRSQIGLLPYPSSADFTRMLPNKFFDYCGGGLPILTCLTGHLSNLLAKSGAGWMYRSNDPADLVRVLTKLSEHQGLITRAAACVAELAKDYSGAKVYGAFRTKLDEIVAAHKGRAVS